MTVSNFRPNKPNKAIIITHVDNGNGTAVGDGPFASVTRKLSKNASPGKPLYGKGPLQSSSMICQGSYGEVNGMLTRCQVPVSGIMSGYGADI